LSNLTGAKTIEGGRYFALASTSDGTVWGWGYNAKGQLGNGTTTKPNAGQKIPAQSTISDVQPGTTTQATYAYDGDGLRTSKTVSGSTTSFTWDGSPFSSRTARIVRVRPRRYADRADRR
jgi:YD repeat-containing protein